MAYVFGHRKKDIDGVYYFLVYMQTAQIYTSIYIHQHGGAQHPDPQHPGAVCIYTKKWYTPAVFSYFLGPNRVVVYIYEVHI